MYISSYSSAFWASTSHILYVYPILFYSTKILLLGMSVWLAGCLSASLSEAKMCVRQREAVFFFLFREGVQWVEMSQWSVAGVHVVVWGGMLSVWPYFLPMMHHVLCLRCIIHDCWTDCNIHAQPRTCVCCCDCVVLVVALNNRPPFFSLFDMDITNTLTVLKWTDQRLCLSLFSTHMC